MGNQSGCKSPWQSPNDQQPDMTTLHSCPVCEVHNRQGSAQIVREPPSRDSLVSTLDEGASSHGSLDCWGNMLETKREKTVWIVFQNIAGLSKDPEACDMKFDFLQQWITQQQVEIFGCVKLGTCWDLVEYP